jgi:hypothetical protein
MAVNAERETITLSDLRKFARDLQKDAANLRRAISYFTINAGKRLSATDRDELDRFSRQSDGVATKSAAVSMGLKAFRSLKLAGEECILCGRAIGYERLIQDHDGNLAHTSCVDAEAREAP